MLNVKPPRNCRDNAADVTIEERQYLVERGSHSGCVELATSVTSLLLYERN